MFRIMAASLLQAVSSFILVFALMSILALEDFGFYAAIVSAATLSLAAFNFGTSSRYQYEIARNKLIDVKARNIIFSSKFLIHFPLTLALCCLYAQALEQPLNLLTLFAIVVYVFCQNIQQILVGEHVSLRKYNKVILTEVLFRTPSIIILIIGLYYALEQVVLFLSISSFIILMFLVITNDVKISKNFQIASFFRYAVRSKSYFINSAAELLFWRLGIFLMPFLTSLEETGGLQINISVLMALGIIPLSISKFYYPRFVSNGIKNIKILSFAAIAIGIYCLLSSPLLFFISTAGAKSYLSALTAVSDNMFIIIILTFLIGLSRLFRNYDAVKGDLANFNQIYLRVGFMVFIGFAVWPQTPSTSIILKFMAALEFLVIILWILKNYKKENIFRPSGHIL